MKVNKTKVYKVGLYGVSDYSPVLMKRVKSVAPISKREYATAFQRDKERIMHSKTFKILKYKSQVVDIHRDELRKNKLTHTFDVAEIAKKIGIALELNTELIRAIALGHDLGCAPFGHIGERALHQCATECVKDLLGEAGINGLTGFKHNIQSLHLIDEKELLSKSHDGLNLTFAVREGIVKHASNHIKIPNYQNEDYFISKENINYEGLDMSNINMYKPSITLEGQTVALADKIVAAVYDFEESLMMGCLTLDALRGSSILEHFTEISSINNMTKDTPMTSKPIIIKSLIHGVMDHFVNDVISKSFMNIKGLDHVPMFQDIDDVYQDQLVMFSDVGSTEYHQIKAAVHNALFRSERVILSDEYLSNMVKTLFKHYYKQSSGNKKGHSLLNYDKDIKLIREVCDFISGMSDESVMLEYYTLLK